jgi:hypothetical protein
MTWPSLSVDLLEGRGGRPSPRVQAVHLLSRIAMVLLLSVSAAVLISVRAPDARPEALFRSPVASRVASGQEMADGHDPLAGEAPRVAETGHDVSSVIVEIDRAAAAVGGDVIELRLDNPRGERASLALRADLPDPNASAIALLLENLEQSGLDGPRVVSVVAVPDGGRLDVVATFAPSTVPRPRAPILKHHADVSVRITDLASSTDVELRRLDTAESGRSGTIRLRGVGDVGALVRLLVGLEDDLSSPSRIRMLRLDRAAGQGDRQLDVTFVLRAPTPRPPYVGIAP